MKRLLSATFVALLAISMSFAWSNPNAAEVPAHHTAPPAKSAKLAPIITPDQLPGELKQYPFQPRIYQLAAKVDKVLYQMPCYCFCDRSVGHKSLRTCFETSHGAHCSACMKEALYAYQMTRAKKTPAQIRAGIIRGDWQNVDLNSTMTIK
jgi:hypothetical protein